MEQKLGPHFTQNWVFILTKLATHHVATVKLQDVLKLMVKKCSFHCSEPLILQKLFVEEKAVILVYTETSGLQEF